MSDKELFIEERQKQILDYLNQKERVLIPEIMSSFNISKTTVRRDLMDLEKRNLIIRTRGGALKKKFFKYESSLDEKKILNSEKKKKIAGIAKKYIKDGDVIFISGGTTTFELSKLLYDYSGLIIFTNAINILIELSQYENIKLKLLGGDFRKNTLSAIGADTLNQLQNYNFDKAFIGANGISLEEGVTTPNDEEAKVDGEVVKKSKATFLLVDDTKFGAVAFSKICNLIDINYILTNKELENKFQREIEARGIEIIY